MTDPREQLETPDREYTLMRWGRTAILAALLAVMAGRMMLNEPAFHRSAMTEMGAYLGIPADQQIYTPVRVLRPLAAVTITALAAAWAVMSAVAGKRQPVRHPLFAVGVCLLSVLLFISAAHATDRREGFVTALEQSSLLLAAALAMQVTHTRWRHRLVLIVLVGMAATLGLKGLYQAGVEIPENAADFAAHRAERLADEGVAPNSPEATMLEARIVEITTKGWFSLANVFGSLMVMMTLASAGLAADKWLAWRGDKSATISTKEIPPALIAAILSTLAALVSAVTWLLTGSIGAIASGVVAGVAAISISVTAKRIDRWRGRLLAIVIIAFVLASVGLVAFGLARGGLPMRTLQVRWEYWTGSAQMLADRPGWGVGPGNFSDAYLPYRPLGAEESVKNPHNVIVQVLTEYGLPAGLLYLALLGGMLILLAGRKRENTLEDKPVNGRRWVLLIGASAIALRIAATHYPNAAVAIFDNFIPIIGITVGLAVALWTGRKTNPLAEPDRVAGIALVCGAGGFALHNLSDFALFKPAAAMAFWVATGAMASLVRGRDWHLGRRVMIPTAAVLVAATAAAGAFVLAPIWQAERAAWRAATYYSAGSPARATESLARAVKADPLDGTMAADLVNLLMRSGAGQSLSLDAAIDQALRYANIAADRNPGRPAYRELLAQLQAARINPDLRRFGWGELRGDIAGQRESIEKQLTPNAPAGMFNFAAQLAYHQGEYAAALDYLMRAIHVAGEDHTLLNDHLGDVYFRMGMPDKAVEQWRVYRQAVTSEPAWHARIAPIIEEVSRMDPMNNHLRLRLAELAVLAGLTDQAKAELDAAVRTNDALWPGSVLRFNEQRLMQIELLRAKLAAD